MRSVAEHAVTILAPGACALLGALLLLWWLSFEPTAALVEHVPGMDGSDTAAAVASDEVITIGEIGETFAGVPADLPGMWPRFRGPDGDNISREAVDLADSWPEGGPPVLWTVELGEGHAAPAVRNGRVYVLDYDEEQRADALRCFSLADGSEIWRRSYQVKVKRNHGFSRTVPAVTDRHVVTIGPRAHVMCVDAETGEFLWGLDLERDYGTSIPFWYTGQCPLIDGDTAVIAPAGTVLMMGVDLATGEVLWEVPNPHRWQMSHTSVMVMTLDGRRTYVYSAVDGMVGVSANEPDRGTVLWETTLWSHSVLAPSPLVLSDGRIFVTAGYGAGSMMLRVVEQGGTYGVEKLQEFKPTDGMASEQQTPILWRDHLFGIQPKDAGELKNQLVCVHPDDCTTPVWTSGTSHRFGLGPYLVADDKLLILDDDGTLTMIEASTGGYRQLAQAQILDGHDAWGPMALAGGRLLLRDITRMVCLDLGRKRGA